MIQVCKNGDSSGSGFIESDFVRAIHHDTWLQQRQSLIKFRFACPTQCSWSDKSSVFKNASYFGWKPEGLTPPIVQGLCSKQNEDRRPVAVDKMDSLGADDWSSSTIVIMEVIFICFLLTLSIFICYMIGMITYEIGERESQASERPRQAVTDEAIELEEGPPQASAQ